MNLANYHVSVILFFLVLGFVIVKRGGWIKDSESETTNMLYASMDNMQYTILIIGSVWMTGSIAYDMGFLSYVSFSLANLNALRIGWEEDSNMVQCTGFTRSPVEHALGLTDYAFPNGRHGPGLNSTLRCAPSTIEDDIEREDLRTAIVGVIFAYLGGFLFATGSAGNFTALPFMEGFQASTPYYRNCLACMFFGQMLVLSSIFLNFTSAAAQDPTNVFYESVMGEAAYAGLLFMFGILGLTSPDRVFLELALFMSGFGGLACSVRGATVRAHMKAAIDHTAALAAGAAAPKSMETTAMDQLSTANVALWWGTVFVIIATVALLGRDITGTESDDKIYGRLLDKVHGYKMQFILGGVGGGLFTLIGSILVWVAISESLDEIDADNTQDDGGVESRKSAADGYVFYYWVVWFFIFAQSFDGLPHDGKFTKNLRFLKPLVYVAGGYLTAAFTGLLSVGTHDRQLWFVDMSLGGINEQRAAMQMADDDAFIGKRSYDTNLSTYENAFAGNVLFIIGICFTYTFSHNIPFTFEAPKWTRPADDSLSTVRFACFALASILGWIGSIVLWSGDLARPPIRDAASAAPGTVECEGRDFNMAVPSSLPGGATSGCWAQEQNLAGERFTYNMVSIPRDVYSTVFFWTALSFMYQFGLSHAILSASSISLKNVLILGGFTILALGPALAWNDQDPNNEAIFGDALCNSDGQDDEDCGKFKTGVVLIWLQGVFATVGAALFLERCVAEAKDAQSGGGEAAEEEAAPAAAEPVTATGGSATIASTVV
jgi:hypothetical protein